jgi:hypothetical protein
MTALLCKDWEVLGPWVSRGWLNILATIIIATLLMQSGTPHGHHHVPAPSDPLGRRLRQLS